MLKGALCIPLNWYFKRTGEPRAHEWERIINEHAQLANGWTKQELTAMKDFLNGELLILDGSLRVMPAPIGKISVNMTVSATKDHLARVEQHVAAGRLPILQESTKAQLISGAEAYEKVNTEVCWRVNRRPQEINSTGCSDHLTIEE